MCSFAIIGMSPGPLEMVLVFAAVLILFGANNLPHIARTLGRTLEEFRKAAHQVSAEIMAEDPEASTYVPPTRQAPQGGTHDVEEPPSESTESDGESSREA